MGILGALLALPVAATVMMLVEELRVELPGEQEQPETRACGKPTTAPRKSTNAGRRCRRGAGRGHRRRDLAGPAGGREPSAGGGRDEPSKSGKRNGQERSTTPSTKRETNNDVTAPVHHSPQARELPRMSGANFS